MSDVRTVTVLTPCFNEEGNIPLVYERVKEVFNPSSQDQPERKLIVMGCQLDALVNIPSPKTLGLIQRLDRIESVYGVDPGTVFEVWLPSSKEFAAIADAHSFADPAAIVSALRKSADKSMFSPRDALAAITKRRPTTFSTARAELERVVERAKSVPMKSEMAEALESVRRAFDHEVIRPLENFDPLRHASSDDAATLFGRMASGEAMRDWLERRPLVRAAKSVIAGNFPARLPEVDDEDLSRSLKIADFMTKLKRLDKR